MKTLNDYIDPYFAKEGYFSTAQVGDAWPRVLTDRIKEIGMTNEHFYHFTRFFLTQLPHNFNGKSFMGVKIIRIDESSNSTQ